jgi:hypothetical protein
MEGRIRAGILLNRVSCLPLTNGLFVSFFHLNAHPVGHVSFPDFLLSRFSRFSRFLYGTIGLFVLHGLLVSVHRASRIREVYHSYLS